MKIFDLLLYSNPNHNKPYKPKINQYNMEKDIGKIKKNDQTDVVVRIDDFGGKIGLTIREYTKSEGYTGFTKSGTRIPLESIDAFKSMIAKVQPEDLRLGSQEPLSNSEEPQEQQPEEEDNTI